MRDFCFHLEFHNHNLIALFFVLFSMVCVLLLIWLLLVSGSFVFSYFCCLSWNILLAFDFSVFPICYDDLRIQVLMHTPLLPLLVLLSQHLLLSSISDSVSKILRKRKIFNRKY